MRKTRIDVRVRLEVVHMTDGGVMQRWKDYQTYFGGVDVKTVKSRLAVLGFKIPRWGAPIIRREMLDKKIDEKAKR